MNHTLYAQCQNSAFCPKVPFDEDWNVEIPSKHTSHLWACALCRGCFGKCNAKSESHGCDNWKSAHQPDSMSPNTDRGSLSGANNSQRQPSPHLSTDAQYRDLLYWSRTVQRPGVLESQYKELLYWNEPHSTETESNLWKQNHRRSQVVRGAPPHSPHLLQLQRGKWEWISLKSTYLWCQP